jgi:nucleotide-binding universal stress UspA family protein
MAPLHEREDKICRSLANPGGAAVPGATYRFIAAHGTTTDSLPNKPMPPNPMKTKSRTSVRQTAVRKASRKVEVCISKAGDNIIELAPMLLHMKNILVPLDMSARSLKALRYAVPFARQFNAKLILLHVVEAAAYSPEIPYPLPLQSQKTKKVKKDLNQVRDAHIPPEIITETVVRHDFVPDAVVEVARKKKADLIIVSTHGRTGVAHVLLGSTAEKIVRHAPCPVLVVREKEHDFV